VTEYGLFGISLPSTAMKVIYRIMHISTGAVYVGKSRHWPTRRTSHIRNLRAGTHSDGPLQELADRDGLDALTFEVRWRAPMDWTSAQLGKAEDAAMLAARRMGLPLLKRMGLPPLNVLLPAIHPGRAFSIGPGGRRSRRQPANAPMTELVPTALDEPFG
jgi:hypothetical protein